MDELKGFLLPIASAYNPVDTTGGGTAQTYREPLACMLEDPNVIGVAVIMTPTATLKSEDVADRIC